MWSGDNIRAAEGLPFSSPRILRISTHKGREDMEQTCSKQGPKERAEKAYLTSLSALFVMARV